MSILPPLTPSQLLKDAATAEITATIDRGLTALDAGDNLGAAQAFAQATAVSAVYATATAFSLSIAYPVAGLSNALRALSQSPGIMGKVIARSGVVADPLVIIRLENVARSFSAGAAAGWMTSKAIDWLNEVNIGGRIYDLTQAISPTLGTTPDPLVKTIRYVDPLILDLDGDGLEITALTKGILFDANADTIKTGTAWAGADDGILVRDINGNGLIDSGQELFGDETILANGRKAAHGFAALRELDTGSATTPGGTVVGANDGIFDAKDAQYANLRIWRDLNQDDISQANGLKTVRGLSRMDSSRRGPCARTSRLLRKSRRKYGCSPIKTRAGGYGYYITLIRVN